MFDFHEKRKMRMILFSKPVIALIFGCAALFSFSVYDRYVVAREMRDKLEERYAELRELELRAQALAAKVEYLENERGIEEELRNRFDVAREDEQVVILLDKRGGKDVVNERTDESVAGDSSGFWGWMKRVFHFE